MAMLTRRRAIQGVVSLAGGTLTGTQLGSLWSGVAAAATHGAPPAFFDREQFDLLTRIVDVMIPETGTPGALAAGVHHFIDRMFAEWASPERQARWRNGIQALAQRLEETGGEPFLAAPRERQLETLRAVDRAAFATDGGDDFFLQLKRMVLFGYYSSEAGATVELQYEPLQPEYKACVPIGEIGRTWFWLGFSFEL